MRGCEESPARIHECPQFLGKQAPSLQMHKHVLKKKKLTLCSYLLDFSLPIWNGYWSIDGTKRRGMMLSETLVQIIAQDLKSTSVRRMGFSFPASTACANIAQFNMSSLFVLGMICTRVSQSQVCSDCFKFLSTTATFRCAKNRPSFHIVINFYFILGLDFQTLFSIFFFFSTLHSLDEKKVVCHLGVQVSREGLTTAVQCF